MWPIWDILHCSLQGRFYPSMLLYLNWSSPFYPIPLAPLRASNLFSLASQLAFFFLLLFFPFGVGGGGGFPGVVFVYVSIFGGLREWVETKLVKT